jgi:hypothetical protein
MTFPLKSETNKIFNNLFVFFGTLNSQGSVIDFQSNFPEYRGLQSFIGQNFSEMSFWQNSNQFDNQLQKAIDEIPAENGEKH